MENIKFGSKNSPRKTYDLRNFFNNPFCMEQSAALSFQLSTAAQQVDLVI